MNLQIHLQIHFNVLRCVFTLRATGSSRNASADSFRICRSGPGVLEWLIYPEHYTSGSLLAQLAAGSAVDHLGRISALGFVKWFVCALVP